MPDLKELIDAPSRREGHERAARQEVIAQWTWKGHTTRIVEKLKEWCG